MSWAKAWLLDIGILTKVAVTRRNPIRLSTDPTLSPPMASIRPVCRALATSRRLPARSYATQQSSWKESEFKPSADPQLNGYPDIPTSSYQLRPAKGWDDVQERRNIGEPVRDLGV